MTRVATLLCLLLSFAVLRTDLLVATPPLQDETSTPDEDPEVAEYKAIVQKWITALLESKNQREAGKHAARLFSGSSLNELASHKDPQVAILAAWRLNRRSVKQKSDRLISDSEVTLFPADQYRFIGFVEGRLRLKVPQWWEVALSNLGSPLPSEEDLPSDGWISVPDEILADMEKSISLSIFNGSDPGDYRVPIHYIRTPGRKEREAIDPIQQLLKEQHRIAAVTGSNSIVLVSDSGLPKIVCLDSQTSTERWKKDIWGIGSPLTAIGTINLDGKRARHCIDLQILDDNVVVFGAKRDGLYLEAFDKKSGKEVLHFSTTNWFVDTEFPDDP